MKHVVMYSGGVGSWAATKRVAEQHGTDDLILLFADTKKKNDKHPHRGEDEDLYRFLEEGAANIGGRLEWISRGMNIWDTFEQSRYMGNTRVDPCSRMLKREMCRKWVEENFKPEEVTLYVGIDWSEIHRLPGNQNAWQPYRVEAPMCEAPYLTKDDVFESLQLFGIKRPRLYDMGFAHNNCGGFCVKAGLGQFYTLLKNMPERYAYHEFKQEELFSVLGKRAPFLRQTVNGEKHYLSLKQFREQVEANERNEQQVEIDLLDIGGCGCFSDVAEEVPKIQSA